MRCRHPTNQVYEHNLKEQAKGKGISENSVNTLSPSTEAWVVALKDTGWGHYKKYKLGPSVM